MQMIIRKETEKDFKSVFKLIEKAFRKEKFSDHQEQFLVERLRKSNSFIPEFSLVAELDGKIVGYILLTQIKILNDHTEHLSLALAPVAVLPEFQGNKIGEKLILAAHKKAKELGFGSIILLGHEDYYPKFGYKKLKSFGIRLPFEVPDENCMAIELFENSLKNTSGVVQYPSEFFE